MAKEGRYYLKNRTGEREEKSSLWLCMRRVVFRMLVFLFAGTVVYVLFFSPFLEITDVSFGGQQTVAVQELDSLAKEALAGKYAAVLPRSNFLLFPERRIKKQILERFKRVRSAAVVKKFPHRLEISLEERKALVLWCAQEKCFIIDEKGVAYAQTTLDAPEVVQNDLLRITSQDGSLVNEGERVLDEHRVGFLTELRQTLKQRSGIEITGEGSMYSPMADDIRVKSAQGWDVLLSTALPLEAGADALRLVLEKQITAEERTKLEYVDLRVENRAYFKLRLEEGEKEGKKEGEDENKEEKERDARATGTERAG